jgi:Rab GDP dissociation inhibitor
MQMRVQHLPVLFGSLHTDAVCVLCVTFRGKVYKVPATDMEALRSPLMGLFEKRRARGFFL